MDQDLKDAGRLVSDAAIDAGKALARGIFAKRGNHSEAHISESELATYIAAGYVAGERALVRKAGV